MAEWVLNGVDKGFRALFNYALFRLHEARMTVKITVKQSDTLNQHPDVTLAAAGRASEKSGPTWTQPQHAM